MVMALTSNRFADLRRRRVPRRNQQRHISRVIIGIVGRCDVRHVASYAIYDADGRSNRGFCPSGIREPSLYPGFPSAVWPLPGACAPSVAYSTFLLHDVTQASHRAERLLHFVTQASQSAERGAFPRPHTKIPETGWLILFRGVAYTSNPRVVSTAVTSPQPSPKGREPPSPPRPLERGAGGEGISQVAS